MKSYLHKNFCFGMPNGSKTIFLFLLFFTSNRVTAQIGCQWAYIPVGANSYNNISNAVTDLNGDIIQAGRVTGIADMDPGAGPSDTAFSGVGYNYYLSKTSSTGNLIWVEYFWMQGLATTFDFTGLKINSNNEIIVTGNFFGLVDFDLSPNGVDTLRSHFPTYPDYFVAKYDASGGYQWAFNIGNPTTSNIESQTVSIQPNNDIVVAANPVGTVDVDPGTAVHNCLGINANIICYDNYGNYLWNNNIATTYSYAINNKSLDGDAAGNNYLLSVGYYELTVNKFNSSGQRVWDKTIGDFNSQARVNPQSLLVDKVNGNFYVAGTFGGTVDFDPGAAVVNKTSSSFNYQDGFIAKYDSSMNLIWINAYVGNVNFGNYSMDFFNTDLVAVGSFQGTVNFGNGFTFSSPTYACPFYIKTDNSGNTLDGYKLNGSGNYNTVNYSNQVFATTGSVSGTINMSPIGTAPLLSSTFSDGFSAVYGTITSVASPALIDNTITVFPNPATDLIYVKSKMDVVAELLDLNGRIILSEKIQGNIESRLNVSHLSNGVYILKAGESIQKITVLK